MSPKRNWVLNKARSPLGSSLKGTLVLPPLQATAGGGIGPRRPAERKAESDTVSNLACQAHKPTGLPPLYTAAL